ncbi:MAG: HlyD family type I secretion periplasmic adaptor subunit [Alphaproteobacteria bacterium]
MAGLRWEDADFLTDVRAVSLRGPRRAATLLLLLVAYLVGLAVWWAHSTSIDEVTRGAGKVIPSGQVQVVQNLEGGIVAEILVREGEIVERDQVLLRIDNTTFQSSFQETTERRLARLFQIARLTAEVEGGEPIWPTAEAASRPGLMANEQDLYASRRAELASTVAVLENQATQKRQELTELRSNLARDQEAFRLASEELKVTEPLADRGVISKVELLRLKRQVNDLRGTLEATRLAIPRAQTAIEEAERRIEERRAAYRAEAQAALNEAKTDMATLEATSVAAEDRVLRTAVKAPVRGTVKRLMVNTVGGVVRPGADLVEIVPLEDRLLIEARVRPSDIAFLHADQAANVRISAYDFAVYGGLKAKVEQISADAITDADDESYFVIRLRTERNFLGTEAKPLPIIPGMTATVDILTGRKTILDYLLNPILRARETALRER